MNKDVKSWASFERWIRERGSHHRQVMLAELRDADAWAAANPGTPDIVRISFLEAYSRIEDEEWKRMLDEGFDGGDEFKLLADVASMNMLQELLIRVTGQPNTPRRQCK